jgi:hypothetical protein
MRRLLLGVLVLGTFSSAAIAHTVAVTFIEDLVSTSLVLRIVRVRILERHSLTWGSVACGFRYRAQAVEWLKGSGDELEFFDAHTPIAVGQDSFVITLRWERVVGEDAEGRRRCLEQGLATGQIAAEHMAFDGAAAAELGGEWLRRQAAAGLYARESLDERKVGQGSDSYSLFRWERVKSVVEKALRAGA